MRELESSDMGGSDEKEGGRAKMKGHAFSLCIGRTGCL